MIKKIIYHSRIIISVTINTISTSHKVSPFYLIITLFLTLLKGISPLIFIYLTEKTVSSLINDLNDSVISATPFFFIFMQFLYLVVMEGINYIDKIINFRLYQKMEYYFNNETFSICTNIPLIYYDDLDYYNSLEKATTGIGKGSSVYLQEVRSFVQSSITFIGFVISLYVIHWSIALFLFFIVILLIGINIYTSKSDYEQFISQILKTRKIDYFESLFKSKEVAKELRIFKHSPYLLTKWKGLFWQVSDEQYSLEKKNSRKLFTVSLLHFFLNLVFLSLIGFYVLTKKITIGKFVALSQVLSNSINISYQLASALGKIFRDSLTLNDYYVFKDTVPSERSNLEYNSGMRNFESIRVDNISFSYPNHEHLVLKNISFEISAGKKVAIVGRNGSGKSTLVKCLTGLYSTVDGEVLLNEEPLTKEIREKFFSAVFQDFLKYEMSIHENIALTNDLNDEIENKLIKVIKRTGTSDLLHKYDLEISDNVGATLHGRELSGGEWQKIALSRALFKDSPIIILDEPTAALDPVSEAKIIEEFLDISIGKTSIFVTHRLGSCINADVILVMKDGELVEQGTHDELILLNGEYTELFNMQAKWYKQKEFEYN
ncbi:ABC transporter ATP-binding protein [Lysinibacillus sp. NPDC058147]|uniref:ABC transporter ATP-binding protein n=1 Tax=unclassified Lysinibacillus TaxID=2636778 RepID=UPI0036DE396B